MCNVIKAIENIARVLAFPYRLLLTLYSVDAMIIFLVWFVESIIILCVGIWDPKELAIAICFYMLLYTGVTTNVAVMFLTEFFKFSFIRKRNPFNTLVNVVSSVFDIGYEYERSDQEDDVPVCQIVTDIVLGILSVITIVPLFISYLTGNSFEFFDVMNTILIAIPFGYYCLLFFAYLLLCWKNIITNGFCICGDDEIGSDGDDLLVGSLQHPQSNVVYVIFKIIVLVLSFAHMVAIGAIRKGGVDGLALFLFWFLMVGPILTLDTPFFIFDVFCGCCQESCCDCLSQKIEEAQNVRANSQFRQFPRISAVVYTITFGVVLALIGISFSFPETSKQEEYVIDDTSNKTNFDLIKSSSGNRKIVRPPICFTEVHHLTILQLMALADDSYNNDGNSSMAVLKESFFKETNISIVNAGLVADGNAKMVKYNVTFPNSPTPLSIYSIRGSSTRKDWWLDIELFCSSLMFTVCKRLNPFISRLDSSSYRMLANLITAPERAMMKLTLVPLYVDDLTKGYEATRSINGTVPEMFVGHSLGGGLAKIMGMRYHLSSLSLSGPGISAFQGLFELPDATYEENFATNFIDIVPDMDVVPRVEISGGTEYRILCREGAGECHNALHSLCMMSIICGNTDAERLCQAMKKEEYQRIKDYASTAQ